MTQPARQSLVLVPGLLCTADLWTAQRDGLADVADVSIARHTGHSDIVAIARDLLRQAPDRFALAGLSMGGYVALQVVALAPERVTRLALLDTSARPDTPERTQGRRKLVALGRSHGLAPVQKALMPNLIHKDRLGDEDLVTRVIRMAEDTGLEAFERQQEALIGRPDCRPLLAAICCPTLVVVGDGDTLTPPDMAEELHVGIAGSTLAVIPRSGHLTTMERPEAVNAALRSWLLDAGR